MHDGHTNIMGHLTQNDLEAVLEACRKSDLFAPKEKRCFFY